MNIQTCPDPVARACELGAEIAAAADEIERTRRIPEALLGRLHGSRLFRMLLPRSVDGDEIDPGVPRAVRPIGRHRPGGEHCDDQPGRHIDQEQPGPGIALGDEAADGRP